ncbi:MAG: hypothetical protein OEY33_02760 [Bdellovibrionales bacterium]|jgi:hypothetical protein|nr:hypothetical protein [Bdellovibrionales bacterium]
MTDLKFTKFDFLEFQRWIELDLNAITWQGRYAKDFNEFWDCFFIEGSDFKSLMFKFKFAEKNIKIGPLASWFNWLKEKFICFVFIHKNISLKELSHQTEISLPHLGRLIRDYFLDFYPQFEEQLNTYLQIGSMAHKNSYLTFSHINKELDFSSKLRGIHAEEILNSLEVTLYAELQDFTKKLKKIKNVSLSKKILLPIKNFRLQIKYVRDLTALFVIGLLSVWGIKSFNLWYEKYLEQKIAVYEPQFKWSNKGISFFTKNEGPDENFKLDIDDFDEASVKREPVSIEADEIYQEETDVSLMSIDSLPKDFDTADLERSEYEEMNKRGTRDNRYGNRMVYRVIMKSVDPLESKQTLNELINKYKVTQVDNVRPGTLVPGGVYYNVFVPRPNLKDFLANIMKMDDVTLYETRTRRNNPPGKHRVFIWIKTF